MDLTQLYVREGDYLSAKDWNTFVDWMRSLMHEAAPGLMRTPAGRYQRPLDEPGGPAAATGRWCIVREVVNDADLTVKIEFARRGRNYDNADAPEDYGRYVGEHEWMRTASQPPEPIPPFEDYLHDASVWPHTVGMDWRYFVWPHIDVPGNSEYRDTHVEDTDIVLAMQIIDDWVLFPIYRDYNGQVSESARQFDCLVEE